MTRANSDSGEPVCVFTVNSRNQWKGTLEFRFVGDEACELALGRADTTFVLALCVAKAVDLATGITHECGKRSACSLGELFAVLPGSGGIVQENTIRGYKTSLHSRVKQALQRLSRRVGRPLRIPAFLRESGYWLAGSDLTVVGYKLDTLVDAARASEQHQQTVQVMRLKAAQDRLHTRRQARQLPP